MDLKPREIRLIDALLVCPSIVAAARACSIPESTARHALARPHVRAELRARSLAVSALASSIAPAAYVEAIEVLRDVMATGSEPARVRAAGIVCTLVSRDDDVLDLAGRVAELEAQAGPGLHAVA